MAGRLDGVALGAIGAGGVFIYAGLTDVSALKALQYLVQGKKPPGQLGGSAAAAAGAASPGTLSTFLGIPGVTAAGLPSGSNFTAAQLQALWIANGGSPDQAQNAACHAMQESSGNAAVTSGNPDGGTNVGLWQLDTPGGVGAGYTVAELQDPNTNARITVMATRNGTDWSSWATPGC